MENKKLECLFREIEFNHVIQPIVDLSENTVIGYEVLLRSQKFPDPELLFGYAKEQNQLFDLDMNSISKALLTFNKEKSTFDNLYFFINVFPSTITNPAFNQNLQRLLSITDVLPDSIVFELNEAEAVVDLAYLKKVILELRDQGFLIALDDIGKGSSSIQAMLEIDPDIAKLDRYFAKDLTNSPKKQKAIELMLQLLGEDTTVVLEGFEYEEDLLKAKELGVPLGQGFLLGKPKPLNYYFSCVDGSKTTVE